MASTPQRGARSGSSSTTPQREQGGNAASALLVPVTVARPSRLASSNSRSPSKTSYYNDMDKENNNNNNITPQKEKMRQYDAFMSPLKSAMKVYPVLSPFKQSSRRSSISWTSREFTPSLLFVLQ